MGGRRECQVRAAPAVSCAMKKWVRARAYRLSGGIRHPLRNGFTAYTVLSSATNSSCHRRWRIQRLLNPVGFEFVTADLAPATVSGPNGFAVFVRLARLQSLTRLNSPRDRHCAPTLSRPPH